MDISVNATRQFSSDPKQGVKFIINHQLPKSLITQAVWDLVRQIRSEAQKETENLKAEVYQLNVYARAGEYGENIYLEWFGVRRFGPG
jgi:hypothetical protein